MIEGPLRKMRTELNEPIDYYMTFPSLFIRVNDLIGKSISLTHMGFSYIIQISSLFTNNAYTNLRFGSDFSKQ